MKNITQLSLEIPLRELRKPVCRSDLQVIVLPVEIVPVGLDECWLAFLHLSGSSKPAVSLACPGVSDGTSVGVLFILDAVLEGRGFEHTVDPVQWTASALLVTSFLARAACASHM